MSHLSAPSSVPLPGTPFLAPGRFQIGANYWASHAGTFMWREWDEKIVEGDFAKLSAGGLELLRVFPLWPDFQPIHCLRREKGMPVEFRHGETPLPDDAMGRSGVSPVMLDRLEMLCDLAARHGLGLVVGLVTGWMSGRLFVPPALEGLNHVADPASVLWQVRLVKAIVSRLRGHEAIRAWDLGNECNCLAPATREQSWLWTASIANAIRSADPELEVVSGMHSLTAEPMNTWSIRDQSELTDILTTHPYPLFTAHVNREPMNTLRPLLHGTAETRFYGDLSGKSAFVEETGNFGPSFCDENLAAEIVRAQIYSLWAHDCRAQLWWCAHEQSELAPPPYDWVAMERELGLLRLDGSPKPVFSAMGRAAAEIRALAGEGLPARQVEAVCLLTEAQDQWGAGFSAFLLAKQAGFDLQFCYGEQALPDAPMYLLPSICNLRVLSRRREIELCERVREGAILYVSADDGFLSEAMKATGLRVMGRHRRATPCVFRLDGEEFTIGAATRHQFEADTATVLAEENGCPVFSVAEYGKGKVYFLSVPLETFLAGSDEAFLASAPPYWKIYARVAEEIVERRHIRRDSPAIGITEHPGEDGGLRVVFINHQPATVRTALQFSPRHAFAESQLGPTLETEGGRFFLTLPPNEVAVWRFDAV